MVGSGVVRPVIAILVLMLVQKTVRDVRYNLHIKRPHQKCSYDLILKLLTQLTIRFHSTHSTSVFGVGVSF